MAERIHDKSLADKRAQIQKILKMGLEIADVQKRLFLQQEEKMRYERLAEDQGAMLGEMTDTFSNAGQQATND